MTCKQCGKRMPRAHAFSRRYWMRDLTGLKIVYRCECGARRAVVLFDEDEVIEFVKMIERTAFETGFLDAVENILTVEYFTHRTMREHDDYVEGYRYI